MVYETGISGKWALHTDADAESRVNPVLMCGQGTSYFLSTSQHVFVARGSGQPE